MTVITETFKNILIGLPLVKKLIRQSRVTGVNQSKEGIRQIVDTYSRFTGFTGKDVIELGPGQTYGVACMIKEAGARSVSIIDIERYIPDQVFREHTFLNYIIYKGNKMPVENNTYDLVISHTVYEHIRHPKETVGETYRILREGGMAIHLIDLADHMYYGKNINPDKVFNCLRYSEKTWNRMSYNRSVYVNRLRQSEWIKLHERAGFDILHTELTNNCDHIQNLFEEGKLQYLKGIKPEDRFVSAILLVAKK